MKFFKIKQFWRGPIKTTKSTQTFNAALTNLPIGDTCCLDTQFCDLYTNMCIDHQPALRLNKNAAHKFVVYSFLSYCLPGLNLTTWDCYWCNEVPKVDIIATAANADADSYGFVGLNSAEKLIVVSFRGTCDYDNIMTDTNFIKTRPYPDYPSLEVHLGFFNAYSSISSTILKGVVEVCYNIFTLLPLSAHANKVFHRV